MCNKVLLSIVLYLLEMTALYAQNPPSTARMGMTPNSPQSLEVYDNSGTWVPIGSVSNQNYVVYSLNTVNPVAYGAKCDGTTNDDAAMHAAVAAVTSNTTFFIPGQCVFSTPLVFPATGHDISIRGNGGNSAFVYKNDNAKNVNAISIGTFDCVGCTTKYCSIDHLNIDHVGIYSNTQMTGGDALLLNDTCHVHIDHIYDGGGEFFGNGANKNWWNALHLNGGTAVRISHYTLEGQYDGFVVNGNNGSGVGVGGNSDIILSDGYIVYSGNAGLHVAGNVIGLQMFGYNDLIGNLYNVLIDQANVSKPNDQVVFGPGVALDETQSSTVGWDVYVTDPGLTAWGSPSITFKNTWVRSGGQGGIYLGPNTNWHVQFTGGVLGGYVGLKNDSTLSSVSINGTELAGTATYAIQNTVTNPNFYIENVITFGNPLGDFLGVKPISYTTGGGSGLAWGANTGKYFNDINLNGTIAATDASNDLVVKGSGLSIDSTKGIGGGNANLYIDSTPGYNASVVFANNNAGAVTTLWTWQSGISPKSMLLYDGSSGLFPIKVAPGGNTTIGETGTNAHNIVGSLTTSGSVATTSGGFIANGNAGVSCSGAPTSSFAVVNGIVTHC